MRPHYWQVTAKARYADPIQYIGPTGHTHFQPVPGGHERYVAFVTPVVVAYTAAEAAQRFREEHVPPGTLSTDILTVQRLGPYDYRSHKESASAARETAI